MNSLLQLLYLDSEVRSAVLEAPVALHQTPQQSADDVVLQLQRLFQQLAFAQCKALTPTAWVHSYKDMDGQPVNVLVQQDAQEFLTILCDMYEKNIKARSEQELRAAAANHPQKQKLSKEELRKGFFLHTAFAGMLSWMVFKEGGSLRDADVRETPEDFINIQLAVKGFSDLEQSLAHFFAPEQIPDFIWDDEYKDRRTTITKQPCFSVLSDTLIFHLRRFEFNFDTLLREKVNDSFSFPISLDLKQYSRDVLGLKASTSTSGGSGGSARPDSYYRFTLAGVVVHSGTADSGHYYSFARMTEAQAQALGGGGGGGSGSGSGNTSNRCSGSDASSSSGDGIGGSVKGRFDWISLNDAEVGPVDEAELPNEFFGGTHYITPEDGPPAEIPNQKSAYMLIYKRSTTMSLTTADQPITGAEAAAEAAAAVTTTAAIAPEASAPKAILDDNLSHALLQRTFSAEHLHFMIFLSNALLVGNTMPEAGSGNRQGSGGPPATSQLPPPPDPVLLEGVLQLTVEVLSFSQHSTSVKRLFDCLTHCLERTTGAQPQENRTHAPEAMEAAGDLSSLSDSSQGQSQGQKRTQLDSPAELVLLYVLEHMDSFVSLLLRSADAHVRMSIAFLLQRAYADVCSSIPAQAFLAKQTDWWDCDQLGGPLAAPAAVDHMMNINIAAARAANVPIGTVLAPLLLVQLTRDPYLQQLAPNWRRSGAYCWLLREIGDFSWGTRYLMNKREIITSIADIILGDRSLANNAHFYPKDSRSRAPTSCVRLSLAPGELVNGQLETLPVPPSVHGQVPDWSDLVDLMASLVCSLRNHSMMQGSGIPPTLLPSGPENTPKMSERDSLVSRHDGLYNTLVMQARYAPPLSHMMKHVCFEFRSVSDCLIDILARSLSHAPAECTAHIFQLLEALLLLEDSLQAARALRFFHYGLPPSPFFSLMRDKEQTDPRLVCVCIDALAKMLLNVPAVRQHLTVPKERFADWAPNLLRFLQQWTVSLSLSSSTAVQGGAGAGRGGDAVLATGYRPFSSVDSHLSNATGSSAYGPHPPGETHPLSLADISLTDPLIQGAWLVTYRDVSSQRLATWFDRATAAQELLESVIQGCGGDPHALVPATTTSLDGSQSHHQNSFGGQHTNATVVAAGEIIPEYPPPPPPTALATTGPPLPPLLGNVSQGDALSDEQFEAFLRESRSEQ
jgi:hypothetical protein